MNKAILMGRLVRDPELRSTQSNLPVCTFTIAVDRRFKNANGERQADFIPVVVWRQQAEFVSKYFRQGSRIAVVGSIQTRSWDDQEGKRRYTTEVVADEVHFADSKREEGSTSGNYSAGQSYEQPGIAKPFDTRVSDNFMANLPEDDTSLPFDI